MRKRFTTTRRPKLRISDREFARRVERQNAAELSAKAPRPKIQGPRSYSSALGRFDGCHIGIGGARRGLTS